VILFHPFNENQYQQRYLGLVIILRDMMERSYRPSFRIALAIMEEREWRVADQWKSYIILLTKNKPLRAKWSGWDLSVLH
jgi:hypothetical protein